MEKIRTTLDERSVKELLHGAIVLAIISFAVSLLTIALFLVFFFHDMHVDPSSISLLIAGGILLLSSILLYSMQKLAIKRARQFAREATYEFLDDVIGYEVYRDEQLMESGKLPYQDFLDYRETKNYIFVRLRNNTYLAIDKVDGLSDFLKSKGLKRRR